VNKGEGKRLILLSEPPSVKTYSLPNCAAYSCVRPEVIKFPQPKSAHRFAPVFLDTVTLYPMDQNHGPIYHCNDDAGYETDRLQRSSLNVKMPVEPLKADIESLSGF
jgi:hypothetical protein